jgi:hypothetical protein
MKKTPKSEAKNCEKAHSGVGNTVLGPELVKLGGQTDSPVLEAPFVPARLPVRPANSGDQ